MVLVLSPQAAFQKWYLLSLGETPKNHQQPPTIIFHHLAFSPQQNNKKGKL